MRVWGEGGRNGDEGEGTAEIKAESLDHQCDVDRRDTRMPREVLVVLFVPRIGDKW